MKDSEPFVRPPINWSDPEYSDAAELDEELRRVFDVCHTCRRCEMLCDSFPRLFESIDRAEGELHAVASSSFKSVVDACTLCDMCYPVCPYVPPHVYAVDFPNLMVRCRALEKRRGEVGLFERALSKTDRNGRLLSSVASVANWASDRGNRLTRPLMERVAGVHRDAALPRFHADTFSKRARGSSPAADRQAPAAGRKAVMYATCLVEYNNPRIGRAAQAVLAKNGIEAEVVYPTCCGMPQLERGDLADVARRAKAVAKELCAWIEKGYDVVTLVPSCALMLKSTWPLYVPDDPDIEQLAENAFDICEYVVAIARSDGLAEGLEPLEGGVALHIACHARAQNVGAKSAVMLRMIPGCNVMVVERCSGHGGTWGAMKDNFDVGMKVGESVMRQVAESGRRYLASECPLAGDHIAQGLESFPGGAKPTARQSHHPIELLAMSYGIEP